MATAGLKLDQIVLIQVTMATAGIKLDQIVLIHVCILYEENV